MKIFFDTEFTGLHKDTTLISIGLISEDNRQFYGELTDYDRTQCDDWIKENVIKYLRNSDECEYKEFYIPNYHVGTKSGMSLALRNWFLQFDKVELVSDVCHYDMTLLIDIFGDAFSLPKNVAPACYDINQDIAKKYGISMSDAFDKSREDILYQNYRENNIKLMKHNALYDAKIIRELYQILNNVKY